MRNENFFLVIEGMDGSGKTEISRRLAWIYRIKFAESLYLTFEPHDPSCAGLFIRQVLMKKIKEDDFSHLTLALAFAANRLDHWYRDIRPFISTGKHKIVISDRYRLSSLVYQVRGGLTIKDIMSFNREAPLPDLTIFLNASNKVCHERMHRREQDKELFETKLNETREAYHKAIRYLRKNCGETILEVNADGNVDEVLNDVVNHINEHAPEWMMSQQILPMNYEPEVIAINGNSEVKLALVAEQLRQYWEDITLVGIDHLQEVLDTVKTKIGEVVKGLRADQLASVFIQYVGECGYKVGKSFAWSDIDAFNVSYNMPLGLNQEGIIIISNDIQREEAVIKKIVPRDFKNLNFVILFMPKISSSQRHFEGEVISVLDGQVSPVIKRFDQQVVVRAILQKCLSLLYEDYHFTIQGIDGLRETFREFCVQNQITSLSPYIDNEVK